ncbi:phage tail tube protein [Kribbella sp. WER1]
MAGDSSNASLWTNADVYFAPDGTAAPTDVTTPPAVAYKLVGLLDGDEGFTEAREDETNEHYAWGGILVRQTKSKHKRTIRFVALEDNENTFALVNPGSTRTTNAGLTSSTVKVPVSGDIHAFLFEVREGDKIKRRHVKRAEVTEVAEIKESETELSVFDITITIYPDADGTLYTELEGSATVEP